MLDGSNGHRLRTFIVGCVLSSCAAVPAHALLAFDEPKAIANNASTDYAPPFVIGEDWGPHVTSNGSGTWVSAWSVYAAYPGPQDVFFTRSTDDGRTWSPISPLDSNASVHHRYIKALASAGGTFVAVWQEAVTCRIARSVDGATWSSPETLPGALCFPWDVAGDGAGNWVVLYSPTLEEVSASYSSDDAVTWSLPAPLPNGASPPDTDGEARIATDAAGAWIGAWAQSGALVTATSLDAGQTWTVPVTIEPDVAEFDLAIDGAGTWGMAFENDTLGRLYFAASSDDGATWNPAVGIAGSPIPWEMDPISFPSVHASEGTWEIVWTHGDLGDRFDSLGPDSDIVSVRSFDEGATWTYPAAVNVNARTDNLDAFRDWIMDVERADNGTAIVVWQSDNDLNGAIGSDWDILFATSRDDCPTLPMVSCAAPTESRASSLLIKNPVGTADSLRWTWKRGQEVLPADLGDPTTSSHYALCVYDKAGPAVRAVLEADATAGESCASGACWAPFKSGYRYRDSDGAHGALRNVTLLPGPEGESSIVVKASGPALAPPNLPLSMDPAVRIQLVNTENGRCWEATFSTAQMSDATRFKARSD